MLSQVARSRSIREAFNSLLRSLLDPDRASALLQEFVLLIESGALNEALGVLKLVARGCDVEDMMP